MLEERGVLGVVEGDECDIVLGDKFLFFFHFRFIERAFDKIGFLIANAINGAEGSYGSIDDIEWVAE